MNEPVAVFAILALLTAGALFMASLGQIREKEGRAVERFRGILGIAGTPRSDVEAKGGRLWKSFARHLLRAGLEPSAGQRRAAVSVLASASTFGAVVHGLAGAVLLPLTIVAIGIGYVEWLVRRRREQILSQLPGFLDHVSRAVATGSSVQQAITLATQEAKEPIRMVFERVDRLVRLGEGLDAALDQSASVYGLRELDMLSLTVRVSVEYGGGVRQTLAGIVTAIRQREQAQRELRALTGETRASAWILGALPLGVATYVSVVNPQYIGQMWDDPAGRGILWACLALQAAGCFLLWRMVRAIG